MAAQIEKRSKTHNGFLDQELSYLKTASEGDPDDRFSDLIQA